MDRRKLGAEVLGTFVLVLGRLRDGGPRRRVGVGTLGISFAFGLTVLTGAYTLGHISGGTSTRPSRWAWSLGKRFPAADAPAYVAAQVIGALLAATTLYAIASGIDSFDIDVRTGFAANGYDDLSPGGYNLAACFLIEVVLTAVFLLVIMGATRVGSPAGTAPLAIGLALTLIHLISIPVTNTSVNPARSTSQAVFAGGDYIPQLWLFWVAPILGGVLGALVYRGVLGVPEEDLDAPVSGDPDQSVS